MREIVRPTLPRKTYIFRAIITLPMHLGLFLPCYIDQLYPQVGRATLSVLEKLGHEPEYPMSQTCCGQPMANSGFELKAKSSIEHFRKVFGDYDMVVAPSASCVLFVKEQLHESGLEIMELSEFIRQSSVFGGQFSVVDSKEVVGDQKITADGNDTSGRGLNAYPKRVGIHESCHGLRGLRLGKASELVGEEYSYLGDILSSIPELELVKLARKDECCGFGGTFSVVEEAVSVRMGKDRLADHKENGAQVITATDMSCLMHLNGLAKRDHNEFEILHFSEILDKVLP